MKKVIFSLVFISLCYAIKAQEKVQIFSGGNEHFRFENGSLIFKKNSNIGIGDSTMFNALPTAQNLALGNYSGKSNYDGLFNTFIGHFSGEFNSNGGQNTFLGFYSGRENNSGSNNTFLGYASGYLNDSGHSNTAIGASSLQNNTQGQHNVAIGRLSLYTNLIGERNVAIGSESIEFGTETNNSIAIGYKSLQEGNSLDAIAIGYEAIKAGSSFGNIGIGTKTLSVDSVHMGNIAIGYEAGKLNNFGYNNIFIGYKSGTNNFSGDKNTFIGHESGIENIAGSNNTFVGNQAGNNSKSTGNTLIGNMSGYSLNTGGSNTAFGDNSLTSNVLGSGNSVVGFEAMRLATTGDENSVLGKEAMIIGSGDGNVAIGAYSGNQNWTGDKNVFIGYKAGYNEFGSNKLYIENSDSNDPLIYGDFSTNEVGINGQLGVGIEVPTSRLHVKDGNIKIENGNFIMDNNKNISLNNSAGAFAYGAQMRMSSNNDLKILNFSGNGIGFYTNTTASGQAILRMKINKYGQIRVPHVFDAGLTSEGDFMIGSSSSTSLVFDQNEIMARSGTNASPLYIQNEGGNVGINSQANAPASTLHIRHPNSGDATSGIRIQNDDTAQHWTIRTRSTSPGDLTLYSDNGGNSSWVGEFDAVSGAYSPTSDARLKKDILPLQNVLPTLMLLNPTSYQYKSQKEEDDKRYIGLLAQEVAQYFPEAIKFDKDADIYHMNYDVFGVLAIKAIQELKQENEILKSELKSINDRLNKLEER